MHVAAWVYITVAIVFGCRNPEQVLDWAESNQRVGCGTSGASDIASMNDQQRQSQISTFLNQFDKLRIWIGASPSYGHTVASVLLIARLFELGYNNRVQAVYDDIFDPENMKSKLAVLVPGFDPNDDDRQTVSVKNRPVEFISNTRFSVSAEDSVPLGLSGALDGTIEYARERLKVESYVQFQPLYYLESKFIVLSSDGTLVKKDMSDETYYLPVWVKPPDVPNIGEFVAATVTKGKYDAFNDQREARVRNLTELLSGSVKRCFLYTGENYSVQVNSLLDVLALSLNKAQVREPALFPNGAAIITVEYGLGEYLERKGSTETSHKGTIIGASADSDSLVQNLSTLRPTDTMLIGANSLEGPLVEHIIATGQLPMVYGPNMASNTLSHGLSRGKIHLPIRKQAMPYHYDSLQPDSVKTLVRNAVTELDHPNQTMATLNQPIQVGVQPTALETLWLKAAKGDPEITHAFSLLFDSSHGNTRDKIAVGLLEFIQEYNSARPN